MTMTKQERIERARQAPPRVTAKTDKVFAVANGDGNAYEVSFAQTSLGACTCDDFTTRSGLLCMCKHTAAVVLAQWPDNFDRWEAKVREASAAALAVLPADPESEPAVPPAAAVAAPVDADLVAAVVAAALPIVVEIMLDALAGNAEAITAQTAAALAAAQK